MTTREIEAGLITFKAQVGKIAAEQSTRFDTLTARVATLEAALANGEVSQSVTDAFTGVQVALQSLDDTIPDATPQPELPVVPA